MAAVSSDYRKYRSSDGAVSAGALITLTAGYPEIVRRLLGWKSMPRARTCSDEQKLSVCLTLLTIAWGLPCALCMLIALM